MKTQNETTISMPIQDLPLEEFKKLIENGLIEDELPLELLATHYPDLLSEWYPGYPNFPRLMTKKDPIRCRGLIKNEMLTFKDIPGLSAIPLGEGVELEGEYEIFLNHDNDGSWVVHVVAEGH